MKSERAELSVELGAAPPPPEAGLPLRLSVLLVFGLLGLYLNPEAGRSGGEVVAGLRMSAAALGAVLLLGRAFVPRSAQRKRAIASLLVIAWAATLIGGLVGRDLNRSAMRYESRLWSSYHYYLGAKYFAELGYHGLYDQTVAADAKAGRRFLGLKRIRNLATYEKEPLSLDTRVRGPQWSDARWVAFSADVQWFQGLKEGPDGVADNADRWRIKQRSWRRILKDRGYNATPTGNSIYWLLSHVPLSERNLMLLGLLDPLLLLGVFILAARVFGLTRSAAALAWLCLFFGNEFHIVGGPLLYDYLAALVLMACAVHKNRPLTAGIALAYAAMTRVFPAFLLVGFGLWAIVRWREAGRVPRFVDRFARGVAGACLVLFLVGCLNARGPSAWVEWGQNMAMHSDHHRFGNKRIGLQHVFTHDFGLGDEWEAKAGRRSTWPSQKKYWVGAAGLLLLLWALGTVRRAHQDRDPLASLVFSLIAVFTLIVMSRYYWSAACLFFLVGGRDRDGPWEGAVGAGLLAVVAGFYFFSPGIDSSFGDYHRANLLLLLWVLPLLVWRAFGARVGSSSEAS